MKFLSDKFLGDDYLLRIDRSAEREGFMAGAQRSLGERRQEAIRILQDTRQGPLDRLCAAVALERLAIWQQVLEAYDAGGLERALAEMLRQAPAPPAPSLDQPIRPIRTLPNAARHRGGRQGIGKVGRP